MKAMLRTVDDHDVHYDSLMFVCPGCQAPYKLPDGTEYSTTGLHMMPVNTTLHSPQWKFDGNLEAPTLDPSILSHIGPYDENGKPLGICHSYLRAGVFEFLSDCTHPLAGQFVPVPDLPGWVTREDD